MSPDCDSRVDVLEAAVEDELELEEEDEEEAVEEETGGSRAGGLPFTKHATTGTASSAPTSPSLIFTERLIEVDY
jgi:hypothetical protein